MGRTVAAHRGHRLSLLIAEIIEERADIEDWVGVHFPTTKLTDAQRHALRRLVERCKDKFGDYRKQHRLPSVVPFQDDFIVAATGKRAGRIAERQIPIIMEELGTQLSQKADANRPFDRKFVALGAEFDLTSDPPTMLPKRATIEKYERLLKAQQFSRASWLGFDKCKSFAEFSSSSVVLPQPGFRP